MTQLALDVGTGRKGPPGVVAVCHRCGARYAEPEPANFDPDADDGSPWWPGVALALCDLAQHEKVCPALHAPPDP